MLKRITFLFAIILIASTFLPAQVTTSSLTGIVRDTASNETLAGASITATHEPSGTRYSTLSTKSGEFTIHDMRIGGPYRVVVSFVGYETQTFDDVALKLAEPFLLVVQLKKAVGTLEQVIISTTRRNPIMNANRTGAVTNLGIREIQNLPSISRSVNDFTRLTPQANGSSIGGGNYRQNNFTIDGADFNNSFGIGTNLPANGSPISIDALEEISVNVTPYDVRQSGFIGSAINAVTRSGTNTFSGSVYHYFRDANQQGNKVGKTEFTKPAFEFKQYGGRIGGPIIKNKLFFFINYETENQPKQIQTRFAATTSAPFGSATNIARPTAEELDMISQYLLTNFGYDPGPYDNYTTEIERKKFVARLDWNINQKHRFNVRYSEVSGGEPNAPSTSTSGTGNSFSSGAGRTDINALWFKNSHYFQGANFYSLAAELNSKFGKFANTLRGTYTYQDDSRTSPSTEFPFVDILKDGSPFTSFGYESFSYGNLRKVKMYSFVDNISFKTGNHNWTAGAQVDWSETLNGFMRFGLSYYRFASWDDFVNGEKPTDFALTYSLEPGYAQAFPRFEFMQYSAYLQDEIAINKKFRLTLGLRLDLPTYPDVSEVKTHPLVLNLSFAGGQKLNTGTLPERTLLWSPRLGFNYDIYGNRSLQLRGGTGIFTGKVPFVWIVSQVGDAGMLQVTQSWNNTTANPNNFTNPFNPDPAAYRPTTVPVAGSVIPGGITAIDENFKMPQTWKTSIALDTRLPWNMVFTLEGIYNKDMRTSFFRNTNLFPPQRLNVANYPDNRFIYDNPTNLKFINPLTSAGQAAARGAANGTAALNAMIVENGNKGHYASLTAKIDKQFRTGIFASVAYIKSFANNLHDGSGDQPLSAWQSTAVGELPNTPILGYAGFVVPDRVAASLSVRKEYFKHLATTVSFLYSGSIDGRFSYVYGGDFNRDGFNGNDLIYIPKDPSEITFSNFTYPSGVAYTAAQQSELFFKYIEQDKYLRTHKGQYAERNGAQYPWRNQLDVKFMQDIFTNVGKNRNTIQLTLDIVNFGNLINPNWGKLKTVNASGVLVPTNQANLVPGGTTRPTFRLATDRNNPVTQTFRDNVSVFSTYYMQMGVRYIFNQ